MLAVCADAGKEGKKRDAIDPADCRCFVRAVGAKKKISAMIAAKVKRKRPFRALSC